MFLFFTVKQESIKHVEEILQDPGRQPSFSSHKVHAPVSQIKKIGQVYLTGPTKKGHKANTINNKTTSYHKIWTWPSKSS